MLVAKLHVSFQAFLAGAAGMVSILLSQTSGLCWRFRQHIPCKGWNRPESHTA